MPCRILLKALQIPAALHSSQHGLGPPAPWTVCLPEQPIMISACRAFMQRLFCGHTHPPMAVVQANDELLEDPAGLLLCQAPMRSVAKSVVEEVPSLSIFHRNGQMRGGQKHLVHHDMSLETDQQYSLSVPDATVCADG